MEKVDENGSNPKVHPREKSSFWLHLLFCWELPFLYKGYKKPVSENDLYGPLQEHQSDFLSNKLEEAWLEEEKVHSDPSLWRALAKIYRLEFFKYTFILIAAELILRMSQPILIEKILICYSSSTVSKTQVYIYSAVLVIFCFFYVAALQYFALETYHLGLKIKIAINSLIYRKLLKLNQYSLGRNSVGQIVNLLSNDVSRFDLLPYFLPFLLLGLVVILITLGYMCWKLGASSVIGIGFLLVVMPLQMYFGKIISVCRLRTAQKTDQRVRILNEIIGGIKIVKMYTWEKAFGQLIKKARKSEISQIRRGYYFRVFSMTANIVQGRTAIFFCILVYVLTGGTLKPEYVYVLITTYNVIRHSCIIHVPISVMWLSESLTSVRRITRFLTQPENSSVGKSTSAEIVMDNISTKWDNLCLESTLTDVTLTIVPKQLVAIIGSIGSGKSTLLQVILEEIPISHGSLQVGGTISYASQIPWLFPGTIRDNILFCQQFSKSKYDEVIRVCELEYDFSFLPFGDQSFVGEKGVLLSGGQKARINLARAIYRDADFYLFDDPLSSVDVHVGQKIFQNCFKKYLENKTRVLVTHQLQYLESVDAIYLIKEGKVFPKGLYQELVETDIEFLKMLESQVKEEISVKSEDAVVAGPGEVKEFEEKGTVSNRVYRDYFNAGGTFLTGTVVIFLNMLTQAVANGSDFFLASWVNFEETSNLYRTHSTNHFLYIYSGFILVLFVVSLVCCIRFINFCIAASTKLHNNMFRKIIYSPMKFFNTNSSGRILNRFSQDMGSIDERLCLTMFDTVSLFFNILAIFVIVSIVNPWLLVPTLVLLILFFYFRKIYLATSRNLKRIEGRTRSPIYTHLSASAEGLATIRAFNAQNSLRDQFDKYQDLNTSSSYMFVACSGTFGFWLDFFCVIYLAIVIFSFLLLDLNTSGAKLGLSITQTLMMTGMLQWAMKQSTELENQMTSVERVVEYSNLKCEPNLGTKVVPELKSGKIEFKTVSLRYSPENPLVLKRISFEILPEEKIGIVGRTGAGKSSLISILFRLFEFEGNVLIDGIDIKTLSLECLRSNISIIPQEPFLFSGTIRYNLDPFDKYQDSDLWDALEQVEMKTVVSELSFGLLSPVLERGSNFSVGQKQLLCLARAVIKKNKILVLDEATANVDPQTDRLIQKTIRRVFKECTVLTIAHRLETVLDCDRIMVMDDGCVAEFDKPTKLFKKGSFHKILQHRGEENEK